MGMDIQKLTDKLSVTPQPELNELGKIAELGFKSLICNRPDGESADQPSFAEVEAAAKEVGIVARHIPIAPGKAGDSDAALFGEALEEMEGPVLAFCRTGTRSTVLWSLSQGSKGMPVDAIVATAAKAGYDMSGVAQRIVANNNQKTEGSPTMENVKKHHDIVVVGGGAAGIAAAASLKARDASLDIAIIDPAEKHYYQPGWTLVGAGVFTPEQTRKEMASLIPKGVTWIKAAVAAFEPEKNNLVLEGCHDISYNKLIVAMGLVLDWDAIEGLPETLGKNGVTSNYRYDLAPYTWELVQGLKGGKAIFTQPPMPIKCAGAPQKAMYLSSDHWYRTGVLKDVEVNFNNAGPVLFGVKEYVPALMKYVDRYNAKLNFKHNLIKIDGESKTAWFKKTDDEGNEEIIETNFDMIHVCPPQKAPEVISASPLADAAGWVDVDQFTLQHKKYDNIWSLGDVMNAPNAKTAAAARKQAPVVAHNVMAAIKKESGAAQYDGYGSCPLTVERGKIVLAEFGYGGKLLPSMPSWVINGLKPTRAAWFLKETMLPPIYWQAMLKGREWMAKPEIIK